MCGKFIKIILFYLKEKNFSKDKTASTTATWGKFFANWFSAHVVAV